MARAGLLTRYTGFPWFSRSWDCDTGIPDLTGKVALVTGGNTGLGYVTVRELVKHNAKVLMACRTEARATDAINKLKGEIPDLDPDLVVFVPFDLTDIESAKQAAKTILTKEDRLDIVVANAGVMNYPHEIIRGIELQFWNHLGHFALIQELLPLIIKTSKLLESHSRIVVVSSIGHNLTPRPDFSSFETVNRRFRSTTDRYGQSKLSNVLYALKLQQVLQEQGENIRVLTLHPGNVHTELLRGVMSTYYWFGRFAFWMSSKLAMTALEGAKTQLWAATSPEVDELDLKGVYLLPIASLTEPSKLAQDRELQDALWKFSEEAVETLSRK
ncbi:NAD(P)-binding protein [Meredithblackwellia eburnea MCA 4105]